MQHADKGRPPLTRSPGADDTADHIPAAEKPAAPKPDWIEHCDWPGEGVVGDIQTD